MAHRLVPHVDIFERRIISLCFNMAEFAGCEMINAKELQDYVKKNGVSRVGEYISSKLNDWQNVVVHFAVCGASGAGKSTFINRIRG